MTDPRPTRRVRADPPPCPGPLSHRQCEGAFECAPIQRDEETNGRGFVTIGRVLLAYVAILAGVCVLAVYFFRK